MHTKGTDIILIAVECYLPPRKNTLGSAAHPSTRGVLACVPPSLNMPTRRVQSHPDISNDYGFVYDKFYSDWTRTRKDDDSWRREHWGAQISKQSSTKLPYSLSPRLPVTRVADIASGSTETNGDCQILRTYVVDKLLLCVDSKTTRHNWCGISGMNEQLVRTSDSEKLTGKPAATMVHNPPLTRNCAIWGLDGGTLSNLAPPSSGAQSIQRLL